MSSKRHDSTSARADQEEDEHRTKLNDYYEYVAGARHGRPPLRFFFYMTTEEIFFLMPIMRRKAVTHPKAKVKQLCNMWCRVRESDYCHYCPTDFNWVDVAMGLGLKENLVTVRQQIVSPRMTIELSISPMLWQMFFENLGVEDRR